MITIEPTKSNLEESLSRSGLTSFLNRARLAVGLRGEVEVLLSDDSTLLRLNKSFRGKNKPTDVLSFPGPPQIKGQPAHAGDLAISLETAARQADSFGHPLRDEVRILLLHGLLHLSGLDHETDNGEMATRESHLRRQLRLPNTLIERTSALPRKSPPRAVKKSALRLKKPSASKGTSSRPKAALYAAAVERPPHSPRTTTKAKSAKTKHNSRRTA
ncbi:rRNA maturation RNase YbeY [Tunturiibacter lichenicola]|uniref:rRNA maturation RNase YbeY n=1 Tax=Tunturiibacter lichenicola TaxID=2051959 RepID=UPI0021B3D944|nr:rRNA maturation RNase YbeY [Edaphobacter lichenicola]